MENEQKIGSKKGVMKMDEEGSEGGKMVNEK